MVAIALKEYVLVKQTIQKHKVQFQMGSLIKIHPAGVTVTGFL